MFSYVFLHMDTLMLADQQNLTCIMPLEDSPRGMSDRDGWHDRVKGTCAISMWWWWELCSYLH